MQASNLKKLEVGSQKSEVRSRNSEVGSQKSRKSEVRSRNSEVRSRKSEVGTQKWPSSAIVEISVVPDYISQTGFAYKQEIREI